VVHISYEQWPYILVKTLPCRDYAYVHIFIFAERYVLVQVVSRFRDLIGEDVIEPSSSKDRSSIGSRFYLH
jgi:hypothetical protein